jgi:3-oxoacyl-[acyl-carrier-protein] synthase III
MHQHFENIKLEAIGSVVPNNAVSNDFFSELLSAKERSFFEKTVGIKNRYWADKNVTASDLGVEAFKVLEDNLTGFDKNCVDAIIFLSQTPDYLIPFTSNILQNKLGLRKDILCIDINAGCAGFIQGLSTAYSLASTLKEGKKVLLIIAETLSKIISIKDRTTSMLFGDGASAMLISKTDISNPTDFNFFSDGENFDSIIIPDGGYRNMTCPKSLEEYTTSEGVTKTRVNLEMNGKKVFDFTLREVAPSINQLIDSSSIERESIDNYLFHQSNLFIIKQITNLLEIDKLKVLTNIEEFGNTSGVSIPLLITGNSEKLSLNGKSLMAGYGSGLNWGNCYTDLSLTKIFKTKYV